MLMSTSSSGPGGAEISDANDEMGKMLSSSSSTRQLRQSASESKNRSLNRPTTSRWPSVRKRECTSIAME
jgi:hypothetical protein